MNQKDITNQVVQMGKRYKTRSGLEVEVLKVDLKAEQPVVAYVTIKDWCQSVYQFCENGSYFKESTVHAYDLIEVSPYDEFQIDDKVVVSNDGTNWRKRHFAGVSSDGRAMTFDNGVTSWISDGSKSLWNYCVRGEG